MCRVVVRVRPLMESEVDKCTLALACLDDARTVQINLPPGDNGKRISQSYSLDASIPPEASQV